MTDRAQWYTQLRSSFASNAAHGLEAVYELRFDDAPPYHLSITNAQLEHGEGEHASPTVTLYFDTFLHHCEIIAGRRDPMQAFLEGRFRADGHIVLAMRLLQMFVPQYALAGPEQLR